jgi:hypothetical protein
VYLMVLFLIKQVTKNFLKNVSWLYFHKDKTSTGVYITIQTQTNPKNYDRNHPVQPAYYEISDYSVFSVLILVWCLFFFFLV